MRSALAAIGLAIITTAAHAGEETFTGPARVIDGDTIEISYQVIRLVGIDAPEDGQKCVDAGGHDWDCAGAATEALEKMIEDREVSCVVRQYDRYERALGVCRAAGQSETINAAIVRSGYALAYRRYSDLFNSDEDAARVSRSGMWAGSFEEPWEWRKQKKQTR